jgi:hypothetical protein
MRCFVFVPQDVLLDFECRCFPMSEMLRERKATHGTATGMFHAHEKPLCFRGETFGPTTKQTACARLTVLKAAARSNHAVHSLFV